MIQEDTRSFKGSVDQLWSALVYVISVCTTLNIVYDSIMHTIDTYTITIHS